MIGWYNYTIGANDSCNNQNMSTAYTFNITDTTKPEITDIQEIPNPQTSGGPVNISITQNITGISYVSAKKYFSDFTFSDKTRLSLFIGETKLEIYLRERV